MLLPESSIWWLGLLLLGATNFWLLLFSESIQGCQWRCCLLEDGGKLKLTDYGGFWIRVNAEGFWQLGRCVVVYGGLPTSLSQSNKPWHLLFFYDNLTKSDFHYLMRFLKVKWVPR
ncbi:hypothetical protein [Pelagibaculum spongiae]|uniref:hypothetical protein n=1 Tax=Pelagibaculum spongiae TaxID=2080658 RepID=UPI00105762FE|nr:hypothetical protein [Pelagibaculum spongiae]